MHESERTFYWHNNAVVLIFKFKLGFFSYTCLCAIILTLWIWPYKTSTVFIFIFPGCCNIIFVFETLSTVRKRILGISFSKTKKSNLVHGPLTSWQIDVSLMEGDVTVRFLVVCFIYVQWHCNFCIGIISLIL